MKFSIRDLMLLTVIVALAVGACLTWLDRQRLAKENDHLRQDVKAKEKEIEEKLLQVLLSVQRKKPRTELRAPQSFESGRVGFPTQSFGDQSQFGPNRDP